jgi:hypothetical protein
MPATLVWVVALVSVLASVALGLELQEVTKKETKPRALAHPARNGEWQQAVSPSSPDGPGLLDEAKKNMMERMATAFENMLRTLPEGTAAPDFTLESVPDGTPIRLSELNLGKPVVLVLSSFS